MNVNEILDKYMNSRLSEIVQSVIAIIFTLVIAYMITSGRVMQDAVLAIYASIISFYFGRYVGNQHK